MCDPSLCYHQRETGHVNNWVWCFSGPKLAASCVPPHSQQFIRHNAFNSDQLRRLRLLYRFWTSFVGVACSLGQYCTVPQNRSPVALHTRGYLKNEKALATFQTSFSSVFCTVHTSLGAFSSVFCTVHTSLGAFSSVFCTVHTSLGAFSSIFEKSSISSDSFIFQTSFD